MGDLSEEVKKMIDSKAAVFVDTANDGVFTEGEMYDFEKIYDEKFTQPGDAYYYKKALLTYTNEEQATALHLAANNGHYKIVDKLVSWINQDLSAMKDELLNKLNKYHFPPLMIACFRGYHTKGKKDDAEVHRI
jgi:hypothetical protein